MQLTTRGRTTWLVPLIILLHSITPTSPSYATCPCTFTPAVLIEVVNSNMVWLLVEDTEIRVRLAGIYAPTFAPVSSNDMWCEEEGQKAMLAQDFLREYLAKAIKITMDIHNIDSNGDTAAVVYADGTNVGQELLYRYLAMETPANTTSWCESNKLESKASDALQVRFELDEYRFLLLT